VQEEKPTAPFVLSLIAGILILLVGLFLSLTSGVPSYYYPFWAFTAFWFLIFGMVTGVIVIVGAVMMYSQPKQHLVWGIIVLVFSILSVLSAGGLIIGLILGIVGGALGIAWRPVAMSALPPPPTPPVITRVCPQCGRVLAEDVRYCPYCGKALG